MSRKLVVPSDTRQRKDFGAVLSIPPILRCTDLAEQHDISP